VWKTAASATTLPESSVARFAILVRLVRYLAMPKRFSTPSPKVYVYVTQQAKEGGAHTVLPDKNLPQNVCLSWLFSGDLIGRPYIFYASADDSQPRVDTAGQSPLQFSPRERLLRSNVALSYPIVSNMSAPQPASCIVLDLTQSIADVAAHGYNMFRLTRLIETVRRSEYAANGQTVRCRCSSPCATVSVRSA